MSAAQLPFSGQQQFDAYNRVVPLAKMYIFEGGTSTPVIGYTTSALSVARDWPVIANGAGRFPATFIDDTPETVRIVITTAGGTTLYEDTECPVIGPSRWAPAVTPDIDPLRLLPTGAELALGVATSLPGFVRANGRTIGNAASGATERANDDTEALFNLYWADSSYTVTGGRGANAAADWAANKTLVLPSMRGRVHVGVDTMGNSAANVVPSATAPNLTGGSKDHTLSEAEMPAHDHGASTGEAGAHTHSYTAPNATIFQGDTGGSSFYLTTTSGTTGAAPDHLHSIASDGGGGAHNNMQPYRTVWYLIKL